jgi:hypothetical protein
MVVQQQRRILAAVLKWIFLQLMTMTVQKGRRGAIVLNRLVMILEVVPLKMMVLLERRRRLMLVNPIELNSASDDGGGDPEDKSSSNSVTSLSSHTNDGKSSSSDLASAIRNKVDSIIRNSLGKVGHNLFGFSDYGGF